MNGCSYFFVKKYKLKVQIYYIANMAEPQSTTGFFTVTRNKLVAAEPPAEFVAAYANTPGIGTFAINPSFSQMAQFQKMQGVNYRGVCTYSGTSTVLRQICRTHKNEYHIYVVKFTGTLDNYQIEHIALMPK